MLPPSCRATQKTKGIERCSMRNKFFAALLISVSTGIAAAQDAGSSGSSTNPASGMETNALQYSSSINRAGSFGLGILAGEPTSLSGKLWLSATTAIDAGAGWSFVDPDGFQ